MTFDLHNIPTFGIAGNFTGHLEQAGEARDFTNVQVAEANAPKAVFPTYLPGAEGAEGVPDFLGTFPFHESQIVFPEGVEKLQIEPECAIVLDVVWENGQVVELKPLAFGASNDCSIRKEGVRKISQKKNWGVCSKGFAEKRLPIDRFAKGGILDNYRIASFLVRDGQVHAYGEDSAVSDYSYMYEKLLAWTVDKLNHQQDAGPAEPIHAYLQAIGCPSRIMISIGATRYTEYGEHNFLQSGDEAVVVLYPGDRYTKEQIAELVAQGDVEREDVSLLRQTVVFA